jgi:PAS domain S-box-containing protein
MLHKIRDFRSDEGISSSSAVGSLEMPKGGRTMLGFQSEKKQKFGRLDPTGKNARLVIPRTSKAELLYENTLLKQQLASTREHLYSIIQAREILTEELQFANEQLQKTNEELHSFTDELRAANEELIRLNRELQGSNEELAQSEQRYRTMAEGSIQAILIHQDWIIKFANQAFARLFGYGHPDEVISRNVWEILNAPEEQPILQARTLACLRGEAVSTHSGWKAVRKDGAPIWVESSGSVISWQDRPALLAFFIDITERKHGEEALLRHAAELERSNSELEQFAYVASHDLQEPLRMVNSYTQLLAKRYEGKLDDAADEFIGYIVGGATRMYQLINDLLAYSRVSSQGNPFSPTDCEALLANALSNLHVTVQETGAVVTHDPLPMVMADGLQLGQVFQNLISNALKFHGEACPRVHVSAEQRGKEWLFSILDNGIGIDPQFSERIFVIFQRLHSREAYPGTGVGLAICKKIVERHGGRIWADSPPGQGAAFCFSLPAHRRREDKEKLTVVRTTLSGFLSSGHQS